MKRISLCALAGLLLVSAVTFAGPTVEVDPNSIVFLEEGFCFGGQYYRTFEFNVVLTDTSGLPDTGDPLVDNITGVGIGSVLSGPGAAHLTPVGSFNRQTALDWAQVISPATYMLDDYDNASSNSRDADGLLTTGMVDQQVVYDEYWEPVGLRGAPHEEGTVIARFVYWWDGETVDPNDLTISLADDSSPFGLPYLLTNDEMFVCGEARGGFQGMGLLFEEEPPLLGRGAVSGTSLGWGANLDGQLADDTLGEWFFPVPADGPEDELVMSDVVMSDGGDLHTVALREDGTVWA